MLVNILLIIVGFALLIKGADWLVNGSVSIAKKLKIPEIIIGLTIVSIGTSMPELIVSVTSALNGQSDLALGNVIGSNICNILLILGISAIIRPIVVQKQTKLYEIPIALASAILLFILGNVCGNSINWIKALILVVCFGSFIAYTIIMAKRQKDTVESSSETDKEYGILASIAFLVIGIVCLKFGGDFVVNNATAIAQIFGISEKIIGLTIVAIGTSLPELVTSAVAAFKNKNDIAVGNIVGSNIFNILLIVGVGALIKPMDYSLSYNIDISILIAITILLGVYSYIGKKDTITRGKGILFLVLYILYSVSLFIM